MKVKKVLLFIIISIFCFIPVVNAKDDIIVEKISLLDSTGDVVSNASKDINVEFNDLGQLVKYEITLKNNTNMDLYVNDLEVIGSSQKFMKYMLNDETRGESIKANSKGKISVVISPKNEKGAGKNLIDNINFKLLLNDKIENPNTSSNLINVVLLIIAGAIAITIIMTKFNGKKGTFATVIVCFMLLGVSFVFADDTKVVQFNGKVSYTSQNYLETTGTIIENHKANYANSKDIWAYNDKVKNITISHEELPLEVYACAFDLSFNDNKRVVSYLVENGDQTTPYDLYIMSKGVIYAPEDATGLFSFSNVETINGLENIIFDNTVKMTGMFIGDEKLNTVDLSTVDTKYVKDTSYMFYKCYNLDVEESTFNLENTEIKNNMFVQYLLDVLKDNAQSDKNIDFGKISSSTNGQGVYVRSGSENNENPIYYYRGNVDNNNVKFANKCWKMVRTTETGGVKLIYNGTPTSSGYCSSTGTSSRIGTGAFNSAYNSPSYVGYMYGNSYPGNVKAASSITAGMIFGNDIEYKNGKYLLKDTYISENGWATDYSSIGEKYHFTCFSTESSCETVNYIYYAGSTEKAYYFALTEGKTQLNILNEMLINSTNENNSTIKTTIDTWYKNNMINYTSYLEDAVWCNDRSINQLGGWNKDNNATTYLDFGAYERLVGKSNLSLECTNENDKFTVSSEKGNGKLTYPIALLTADEVVLAGAEWNSTNYDFYLRSGSDSWLLSSNIFKASLSGEFRLDTNGTLSSKGVNNSLGIRPAIVLKSKIDYINGTGTTNNPYVIE